MVTPWRRILRQYGKAEVEIGIGMSEMEMEMDCGDDMYLTSKL